MTNRRIRQFLATSIAVIGMGIASPSAVQAQVPSSEGPFSRASAAVAEASQHVEGTLDTVADQTGGIINIPTGTFFVARLEAFLALEAAQNECFKHLGFGVFVDVCA